MVESNESSDSYSCNSEEEEKPAKVARVVPNQVESSLHHGTINAFLIMEEGVILGVDSRATSHMKYLVADDDIKYKTLVRSPVVVITSAGDVARNKELWVYLEDQIDGNKSSIHSIHRMIQDFLKDNPSERSINLLLAGYDCEAKKYVVYVTREHFEVTKYISSSHTQYNCVGMGGIYGYKTLRELHAETLKTTTEGEKAMEIALMNSFIEDQCVGGIFSVICMSGGETPIFSLRERHGIDLLIERPLTFDFSKYSNIFAFSHHDISDVNYLVLERFCTSNSWKLRRLPSCMGAIKTNFNMFILSFEKDGGSRFFRRTKEIPNFPKIRFTFVQDFVVLITEPCYELLSRFRSTNYLHELVQEVSRL